MHSMSRLPVIVEKEKDIRAKAMLARKRLDAMFISAQLDIVRMVVPRRRMK